MLRDLPPNAGGVEGLALRPLDAPTLAATITASYLHYRGLGYPADEAREAVEERNRATLAILRRELLGPFYLDDRVRAYGERFREWGERAGDAALERFVELHERQGLTARKARRRTVAYVAKKHPAPAPVGEARKGAA
jgi:hypothetical protein